MSSSRSRVAALLTTALLAAGTSAHAQTSTTAAAPGPAPTTETAPHSKTLVWAGASLFTLTYLASAVGATTAYADDAGTASSRTLLWVPAVGPFIMMGSISGIGWDALLALDGLAQIGGLTLFVYGLASPPARSAADAPKVSIAPFAVRGASGAALVGTF